MKLRSIKTSDVEEVYKFWQENYEVSEKDSIDRIKIFIKKNPEFSTLAEENGLIVGTTLGSYDGRKGYLQKVVVHKNYRRVGLGERLVKETIEKIKRAGALDIRVNCGKELIGFYSRAGFRVKEGVFHLQIKNY